MRFFCAIIYVLKSGYQWRIPPSNFLKWKTVYFYFQQWNKPEEYTGISLLEQVLKKSYYQKNIEKYKAEKPKPAFILQMHKA